MQGRLKAAVTHLKGVDYVKLHGVIDEDNNLPSITKELQNKTALLSCADVERINSCGGRDWVTWLGELERDGIEVYLLECPPALVSQINLVNNFLVHAKLVSFFAPYYCPAPCDAEKMLLIDVAEALDKKPFRAPGCRCDECDNQMEFDDIENSYFAFLQGIDAINLAPELEELIPQFSQLDESGLRSRTSSLPLPSSSSSSALSSPYLSVHTGSAARDQTIPSQAGGGLLSSVSDEDALPPPESRQAPPPSTLLYAIVVLLTLAITLLAYGLFRNG